MELKELSIGQVVMSKAGRDKGRPFFVVGLVDSKKVLVADGDVRRLQNPKLKKIKHLIIYNLISEEVKNRLHGDLKAHDAFMRKELERLGLKTKREV